MTASDAVQDEVRGEGRPEELSRSLRRDSGSGLAFRRAIVISSLAGVASMAPVTLYQMGIIKRLPDVPAKLFDSNKVNASRTAYLFGMPDGPISLAGHAINLALATVGAPGRSQRRPWLAWLASAKAGLEAAVAVRYLFYQMPVKEGKWCPYCITDAVAHTATFGLTLRESVQAVKHEYDE